MRVHFIAIGGAVMHNMAIALHKKGFTVSGSDDEIFEPARGNLLQFGLLPSEPGWFPEQITSEIQAVILGMHAREDNPELVRAKELQLRIFSFPEYIFEQSKNKKRVVIGGSHGKTTITAMIMHVLKHYSVPFDYMVGAKISGFETMVQLTDDANLIILEGDEYLTSPIDPRPKFHLYKPHIALLSGISWDHINVFPTFEIYLDQFKIFIGLIEKGGSLVYCSEDPVLEKIIKDTGKHTELLPYGIPQHSVINGKTVIHYSGVDYTLKVFGRHNLKNICGAMTVCGKLGINTQDFFNAIESFSGASNRLEEIKTGNKSAMYKDFAHSPSKLKATIEAMKEQYPERQLIACMELHTFSSLNKEFLLEYAGTMNFADVPLVYFNPHTLEHKKLPPLDTFAVRKAFNNEKLVVFTNSTELEKFLIKQQWINSNLLLMSSGNFDGIDLGALAQIVVPD